MATAKKTPKRTSKVKNQSPVNNGLSEAIMGFDPAGIGSQLSQAETLFKNNRWYMVSNMRQLLSEIYVEHGIVQTICNVPVDDGLRGGIIIKSKQLEAEQIEKLQAIVEREDVLTSIVGQALKWNRLYGGAGIVIITDQDPTTPLDKESIGPDSLLEFRAVDLWELFWDKQNTEGYNPQLQEQNYEYYSYYGIKLHKSRVMKLKGLTAPSFVRPRLRGWGFSVVESLVRSINQYLKANDLSFEVLDEFKIDIYKVKGLTSTLMSSEGTEQIRKRVALANNQKNYQNAITMDSEDDYQQKQLSFGGIAEIMREIRMQIASDLRMPLTKIFGISAAGFSSGEDDIENYNAMVESEVRSKCKYDILRILELLCQKEFGMIPDDLNIEFKPLRMLSAEQEENVKNSKFSRLIQAMQGGLITPKEFKDAVNRDSLLPIQLLDETDTMSMSTGIMAKAEDMESDDVGASRIDTYRYSSTNDTKPKEAPEPPLANALEDVEIPSGIDESTWEKAKKAFVRAYNKMKGKAQ
jgi:phage-related protein (TIGR01555 family)